MTDEIQPRMLTRIEAASLADQINRSFENCRLNGVNGKRQLARFIDLEGWKALGYPDVHACVEARFPWSKRHFWRELEAQKIADRLGLAADVEVSPTTLEQLRAVPPEEQDAVWHAATGGVEGAVPTREAVKEAVREHAARKKAFADAPEGAAVEASVVGREAGDDDDEVPAGTPPALDDDGIDEPDEDWARHLPLRGKLAAHLEKRYVADAIGWRHLIRARKAYQAAIRAAADPARKACAGTTPKYLADQAFCVRKRGALEWRLCVDCDGTGRRTVAGSTIGCGSCDGHGYNI